MGERRRPSSTSLTTCPSSSPTPTESSSGQLMLDPSRTLASVSRGSPLAPSVSITFPASSTSNNALYAFHSSYMLLIFLKVVTTETVPQDTNHVPYFKRGHY